jgi:hypothetical protein
MSADTRRLHGRLRDEDSPEYQQAIDDAKKLLRYAVARWGCSTSVAVWEYFNEIDPNLPLDRFYRELGNYLEQIDIYGHLRSTSTWHRSARDCRHPQLDMADVHFYLRPVEPRPYADEVEAVIGNAAWLREHAPAKPALLGEFGLADPQWRPTREMQESREIIDFHHAIWASTLSGVSGTALFWWWDRLDPRDHYPHYRPLADYVADIPWTTARLRAITATVLTRRCVWWDCKAMIEPTAGCSIPRPVGRTSSSENNSRFPETMTESTWVACNPASIVFNGGIRDREKWSSRNVFAEATCPGTRRTPVAARYRV